MPDGLLRVAAVTYKGGPQSRPGEMLLIPANVEEMVHALPNWEKRVWREHQGQINVIDRALGFAVFVRIAWSTPPTWLQLVGDWYSLSRSPSTGHRDHHLRRAEKADMTAGVLAAGTPGSWLPERTGVPTGRRCTSRHPRCGTLRRSGLRTVGHSGVRREARAGEV